MKMPLKIIKSLIAAYVVTFIMLLFLAFLMFKFSISGTTLALGIVAIYLLSNIVSGIIIGKAAGQRRFAWGALVGLLYVVIMAMIGNVIGDVDTGKLLLPGFISVTGAVFGGIIS